MAQPIRLFSIIAILAGGLFGLKAISVTNNAIDFFTAEAVAMEVAPPEDEAGTDEGDGGEDENAEPEEPLAEVPDVNSAFQQRLANRMRSAEEEDVLRALTLRREELDAREAELDTREALMLAMEQRVDDRIVELENLRNEINGLFGQLDDLEEQDLSRIINWYSSMADDNVGNAAAQFGALDPQVQLQIASQMDERKFALILAEIPPNEAATLTQLMATRGDLPETLDELEARLAEES
ncbi:MAG: hypothetical protein JJ884_06285 [Maricaulis sp.]|uniref:MotE family protein n=1 Tax=Maricaulis sp. TaxID=1486257 RepID=UPI001B2A9EC8|nr:hypothetical protein [Maricaulis sp.]MBO6730565.1 hypothetical protein [Maricaulis sp.]MBO6847110.1 hypothetical protein [Maricaulis sp.]MBO6876768.1 hypothetical protein [Maricaulis sp.]